MEIEMDYEVKNIVANGEIKPKDSESEYELDIYGFALEVPDVMYEPEQFPGAIVRLSDIETTFLVFKNCSFICTGGETEEDVEDSLERMKDVVDDYLVELD